MNVNVSHNTVSRRSAGWGLLVSVVAACGLLLVAGATARGDGRTAVAAAAPAAVIVSDLAFSEKVDGDARPKDADVEFNKKTERVWVSFAFREYSGEHLSYVARANGEDWKWGDLDCCTGSSGRIAFPLERRSDKDLGGAAYDVRIYAGDVEVAQGGFGVKGRKGFDNDNE